MSQPTNYSQRIGRAIRLELLGRQPLQGPTITMATFARQMGVHHSTLSQILNGQCDMKISRLRLICVYLELTPAQLLAKAEALEEVKS